MITPPQSPSVGSVSSDERIVRFDNACVLIPESALRSKRPKLVTKSYSLPLWKKRAAQGAATFDKELDVNDENHVVFKVPVPTFLSVSKPRSPIRDPDAQPLSPCLVHRQSLSPTRPPQTRRVSSPTSPRTDVITIPLRSCCENCVHVTEECLKEGIEWREKFSRAARRKRSASLDSIGFDGPSPEVGSTFSATLGLSVDEVDKRRHSHESKGQKQESPDSPDGREEAPTRSSKETPRVSPIEEEDDDDQLFPLPSPRRTPTSSPVPSPNTSSYCLGATSSRDNLAINSARGSISSCEDSDSRVGNNRYGGLLTPDSSPSIPAFVPTGLLQEQATAPKAIPIQIPASPTSLAPTPSSSPDQKWHRPSFSLPSPTQFLKVGADALKGVGVISGTSSAVHV